MSMSVSFQLYKQQMERLPAVLVSAESAAAADM